MVNANKWIYNGEWKSGKANGLGKYFAKDGSGNFFLLAKKKSMRVIGSTTKSLALEN
jgi:hypothetical protein